MATIYDAVHAKGISYETRAQFISNLVAKYQSTTGGALLDVAFGTGRLLECLQRYFTVEGLDGSKSMLQLAKTRLPNVRLRRASMNRFRLGRKYDVITCLGASLCYAQTAAELRSSIASMRRHLKPNGTIIVDSWLQPDQYAALETAGLWRIDIDEDDRKISVLRRHERAGNQVTLEYNYLVGSNSKVSYFQERHRVSLFSQATMLDAFGRCGLRPELVPDPELVFRGCLLYVATKK